MTTPIRVEFTDVTEIRMGSPYNVCRIRMSGKWVPEIPTTDWQDLMARRDDGAAIALVRWDTPSNQPGFRIVVIDCLAREVRVSKPFPGCCQALSWVARDKVAWRAFPDGSGVYKPRGILKRSVRAKRS